MRRTKEEAEQTRQTVIEAALRLFGRYGYSKTTLKAIARESGFSRGPIYWHFRNKTELYEAVMEISQVPLETLVRDTLADTAPAQRRLESFVERWLILLVEDPQFRDSFEILLNKTELTDELAGTLDRERALTRSVIAMFAELVSELGADTRAHADQLGRLCYTYLMGITQTWLFDTSLFDLREEIPFLKAQLRRMLALPPEAGHDRFARA